MKYFVQWHWGGETFKIDIITLNLNMCQLTTETAKWVSMIAVQLWNIKLRPPFRSCKHAQMIILRYAQQWPHTYSIARHASVFIMDDNVKRTYYMIHEKRRCTPWNENIDLSTYFFWGTSMITNMKYFVQGLDKILLIQLL